jgi:hypothetical protein
VAFMTELGMKTSDIFRFELRRAATKMHMADGKPGIQVTDCITRNEQDFMRLRVAQEPILTPLSTPLERGPG